MIEQQKTRLNGDLPPAKLWNEMELEAVESMGSLFDEVIAAAKMEFGEDAAEVARIDKATRDALAAFAEYAVWLQAQMGRATEDYALGREKYDELVGLRAFDGLTSDDILQIGEQQLVENREQRAAAGKADRRVGVGIRGPGPHQVGASKGLRARRFTFIARRWTKRVSTSSTTTSPRCRLASNSLSSRRLSTCAA